MAQLMGGQGGVPDMFDVLRGGVAPPRAKRKMVPKPCASARRRLEQKQLSFARAAPTRPAVVESRADIFVAER